MKTLNNTTKKKIIKDLDLFMKDFLGDIISETEYRYDTKLTDQEAIDIIKLWIDELKTKIWTSSNT